MVKKSGLEPEEESDPEAHTDNQLEKGQTGDGRDLHGPDPPASEPAEQIPAIGVEPSPLGHVANGEVFVAPQQPLPDVALRPHYLGPRRHLQLEPLEVNDKKARVEPAKDGRQVFVFELSVMAFEPGEHELGPVRLRVVTSDGIVGSVETEAVTVAIASLLANEPDAQPRGPTEPVEVMQDDFTWLYVGGAILLAALIALGTWLFARWWERREKPQPPPPPPRPPWEVAVEKLADLRRRKQRMIDEGKGVEFVDEVSDVVREYLGGRFGFDGLETTTDEMLDELRAHRANQLLVDEVRVYLNRCDLVKFAKVIPDQEQVDVSFSKAQQIVQFSTPTVARSSEAQEGEPS